MQKLKVSKKDIRENRFIIGLSYCSAQYLLNYQNAFGYSSGVNGWSCDYFLVDNIVISTGYDYVNSKNTKHSYEMLREYELKAEKISHDYSLPYEEKKNKINQLLSEFINACIIK